MATKFGAKLSNKSLLGMVVFQKGLQYHNSGLRILSSSIFTTRNARMYRFWLVCLAAGCVIQP